jgi:predicted AAA+ superfamily ATPase
MEREILKNFIEWMSEPGRKPLVVTGVRQCGKTYAIKDFGNRFFENLAYFNFEGNTALQSIFEYDFNVSRIVVELERYYLRRRKSLQMDLPYVYPP